MPTITIEMNTATNEITNAAMIAINTIRKFILLYGYVFQYW